MGPSAPAALLAALLALPLLVQEPPPAPAPAPSPPPAPAPSERTPVGRVVAAVAAAALGNAALPEKERVAGDALLDLYVRAAARAAAGDARSFLLGIGHAVDPTRSLEKTSLLSKHYAGVESEEERKARLGAIGKPTLRGRNDHALHFLVSAAFARALGGAAAETLGLSKEMMDAMKVKGSGLSFADLAADYAGIRFDAWLADAKEGAARLARVAEGFRGAEFLPDVSGEVEGLMQEEFEKRFGNFQDERFLREKKRILDAIEALPVFRPAAGGGEGGAGGEGAKPGGTGEGKPK